MWEAVRLERRGEVAEITLDRPKANAIDALTSIAGGGGFELASLESTGRAGPT